MEGERLEINRTSILHRMNILNEPHMLKHVAMSTRATGLSQYLKYHPLNLVNQKLNSTLLKDLHTRALLDVSNFLNRRNCKAVKLICKV